MCGIVQLKRNDGHSPIKPLIERYHEQKSRGQQGYGFVAVKDGKVIGYERAKTFEEIEKKIAKYGNANDILFHHRLPTSTDNLEETAHPIHVSNNLLKHEYYLVHNGVIGNSHSLKYEHEKLGFTYNTEVETITIHRQKHGKNKKKHSTEVDKVQFNDSESLAIEFALWNEGLKPTVDTIGPVAFICYEVDKKTKKVIAMHYGRNTNPLKMFRAHGLHVLSSQSTNKNSVDITPDKCFTVNYETKELSIRELVLDTSFSNSGKYSRGSSPVEPTLKYPNFAERSGVGYDTRKLLCDGTNKDDGDKQTHIMLDKPIVRSPEISIRCIHGSEYDEECKQCEDIGALQKCRNSGRPILNCFCYAHRDATIEYRKRIPITVGTENGPVVVPVEKIRTDAVRTPYFGTRCCVVCKKQNEGTGMCFSDLVNDWVHFECGKKGGEKNSSFMEDLKKQARLLSDKIEFIDDEIDEKNGKIEQLEDMMRLIEDKQGMESEWLKKGFIIEELKKEIEQLSRERDETSNALDRADNFITGNWF